MKNYLARFAGQDEAIARNFEKALPDEPSKPSKPSYEGFEGNPSKTFSDFREDGQPIPKREIGVRAKAMPATCPLECGAALTLIGDLWHCAACDWSFRLEPPDSTLLQELQPARPAVWRMRSAAACAPESTTLKVVRLSDPNCPGCNEPLTLQDRARNAWWCASCRLWMVEGKIQ